MKIAPSPICKWFVAQNPSALWHCHPGTVGLGCHWVCTGGPGTKHPLEQ